MSTWSEDVEQEREKLTEHSVITAKEICGRLKDEVCGNLPFHLEAHA